MSRYFFGLHLDGAPCPIGRQGLHTSVCGPETLLSALETSLGLVPVEVSPLQRALAYRDIIADSLADDHFCARSFGCDPLATARLLLSWRDTLREAGWCADLDHTGAPPRFQYLAALESAFRQTGLAEVTHAGRIAAILAEIEADSRPAIESLIVTDHPDTLPRCWRKLFDALNAEYDDLLPAAVLAAHSTTLGAVQANFLGQKTALPDDGNSIRITTAATPEAAAAALSAQLAVLTPAMTTLIADASERDTLNQHLRRLDLPQVPARTETAAALLELPALVLRCRIAPLDPQAWIEFLLHSISPVPAKLRRRLAEQINGTPGRGPHWDEALETCIARLDAADAIERLRQAYAEWVEVPLIPPDALTGPALADPLSALVRWLNARAGGKKSDDAADAPEWLIASRSVARLESILRAEGTLTRTGLDRLLTEWHQSAAATVRFPGEVGSVIALASPAQLLGPQDHVIWWRPAPARARRSPWTSAERDWLSARGVCLTNEAALALAAESSAARSVQFARKSLTIYHVTQSAGGVTEQAGILTRLVSLCGRSVAVPARGRVVAETIPLRPLPPLRRWWNLNQGNLLPARERESFSSISKIIDAPVDWVLNYHARLTRGSVAGLRVGDDAARKGTTLHAAAEELFTSTTLDWQTATESQLHRFLAEIFPTLLAAKAAHYLTPGNEAARTRLLHSAQQALWHLVEILREAKVIEVTLEKAIDPVPLADGMIQGRIDLIARRADSKTAVIDLKLGGKSNRSAELRANRHLQLATYGHLMLQSEGIAPATAYFILVNGGALLTRDDSFFPSVNPISPTSGTPDTDWQECWREFEQIYQWRRRQLDQGRIEVPVPGTEADDPPPIDRWSPPKDGNPYSDYLNLTGHPANA